MKTVVEVMMVVTTVASKGFGRLGWFTSDERCGYIILYSDFNPAIRLNLYS